MCTDSGLRRVVVCDSTRMPLNSIPALVCVHLYCKEKLFENVFPDDLKGSWPKPKFHLCDQAVVTLNPCKQLLGEGHYPSNIERGHYPSNIVGETARVKGHL